MKKCMIFLADGFEEIEAITVIDILRRAGIHVDTVSADSGRDVTGSHGITVTADRMLGDIGGAEGYDALVTPGGQPGSTNLSGNPRVLELLREADGAHKLIASICASPLVLTRAGLIRDRAVTSFPDTKPSLEFGEYREDLVVKDGNVITSRGPATAMFFALAIVRELAGMDMYNKVRNALLIPMVQEQIKDY